MDVIARIGHAGPRWRAQAQEARTLRVRRGTPRADAGFAAT